MKYINTFVESERIIEHYLCKKKETRESRTGKTFINVRIQDKTGTIEAKVWDLTNDIKPFEEGEIIKIDATVTSFQNELQLKVHKLRRSKPGEYNEDDYTPVTKKNIEKMYAQVIEMIGGVESGFIKTLLENIFINNQERVAKFKRHSAAKHMHHAFRGGLLEHTLAVSEICLYLGSRYEHVNQDILLAGALLHDIGKLDELAPLPIIEYTDDGQMLGHIILGLQMVAEEINKITGFPHETASLIKHLIISHHGEYEYGSPKLPSTPEAMILHFADNIDAKLVSFEEIINKDTGDGNWTTFNRALNRYVRKPGKK